tara:strand:- start:263 stop:388 length:126 start_codon:yes stop_codon:yes gene_type:complete
MFSIFIRRERSREMVEWEERSEKLEMKNRRNQYIILVNQFF